MNCYNCGKYNYLLKFCDEKCEEQYNKDVEEFGVFNPKTIQLLKDIKKGSKRDN